MAFIRAFTLSRMLEIKTGVNSLSLLCLWKMVVLVGILMLNRLPLIGGEPGVQIPTLIFREKEKKMELLERKEREKIRFMAIPSILPLKRKKREIHPSPSLIYSIAI